MDNQSLAGSGSSVTQLPRSFACIGLGSNLGQSRNLLLEAWQALGEYPDIFPHVLSSPYRTKPVAMDSPHWFINAAGLLHTSLAPEALLEVLLATELRFGRVRFAGREGYRDRTIDLDLLLFDEQIMQTERLVLPHPAIHKRRFVLVPLTEIAPQLRHPLLNKTIAELLMDIELLTGQEEIERVSWL